MKNEPRHEIDRDATARKRALDVTRSFLVQAPAGSGKTELLVQRFLALLARVERPERIVALTFTRKAAGEMRERIIAALRDAEAGTPVASEHAEETRRLAQAVLEQDARCGWHLLLHPAQLAVSTIDGLCAGLAQRAPLATRLGGGPRYEENAYPLYVAAARAALAAANPADRHWRRLLDWLDNDAGVAVRLLADLLGKRDQWLPEIEGEDLQQFRRALENTLVAEIEGELRQIHAAFPPFLASALRPLARHAATNCAATADRAILALSLRACADAGLPPPSVEARDDWRALASWLLRAGKPQFRATVTEKEGFPAAGAGAGATQRAQRKGEMTTLLRDLAAVPGLAQALDVARRLPSPHYADDAWTLVEALLSILPRLAAELLVVFRNAGSVDFAEGTLAALDALGREDAPSDLLLSLDLRIDHLLVDEFQDTSFMQLGLIEQLTAGWQQGDGRTLFVVGDPMQSIYRFRGAEVRVFVDAREARRIGAVPIETLALTRNFRAQAALVTWVNHVFATTFGTRNDPWRGTVAFAAATPAQRELAGVAAKLDIVRDGTAEAAAVVAHVRAAQAEGAGSIAILVRARAHLAAVLPALRAARIAFTAVDVDTLAERQAMVDLVSLTHALQQPADRFAWLAVLRAPWCGLTLPDLFAVAAAADAAPSRSVAGVLGAPASIAGISADGRDRLAKLAPWLSHAIAARGRASLAARVRGAWLAIGGPATLADVADLDAAERLFGLIATHERAGELVDWPAFLEALDVLRAEPDAVAEDAVQVMTLHRAKGLEFDTVIIPGLADGSRRGEESLLHWRRRRAGLLLAPTPAAGAARDPMRDYVRFLEAEEEDAELARLLYVGSTRAKRRLYLVAALDVAHDNDGTLTWKAPTAGSGLARLWPSLHEAVVRIEPGKIAEVPAPAPPARLRRLPLDFHVPLPEQGVSAVAALSPTHDDALPFDWARETARRIGIVAHRWLLAIARDGVAAWDARRIGASTSQMRAALAHEGVGEEDLDGAVAAVQRALANTLDDERGRWLFSNAHAEAASEWALAGRDGEAVVHVVLDRTFVADGVRWIVDFKMGTHEGADVDEFLDRERLRYREQLERYARFVAALDPRPIRLALFHPLLRGWREWPYMAREGGDGNENPLKSTAL